MEALLHSLLQPDNAVRSGAERQLEEGLRARPDEIVGELARVMQAPTADPSAVHLSSVILRKCVDRSRTDVWDALMPQTQEACKANLIALMTGNTPELIRTQIELAIAKIGTRSIAEGKWNDLLPSLAASIANDTNPGVRASCLEILSEISSDLGTTTLSGQLQTVQGILSASLQDPAPKVRTAAAEAVLNVACIVDNESIKLFQPLFTPIMNLLSSFIQAAKADDSSAEDFASIILDSMVLTAEANVIFYTPFCKELLSALLLVIDDGSCPEILRGLALECVLAVSEAAPKRVAKVKGFTVKLLDSIVRLVEEFVEEGDTQEEVKAWGMESFTVGECLSMYDSARYGLQRLSAALESKSLAQAIEKKVRDGLSNGNDWKKPHAALVLLCQTAEEHEKYFAKALPQFVQILVQSLSHPHPFVRITGVECLGQFVEDFDDFTAKYHAQAVPALLNSLNDPTPRVAGCAAVTLGDFFNGSEDGTVDAYFLPVLTGLLGFLSRPDRTPLWLQEEAIEALDSVVLNASPDCGHLAAKLYEVLPDELGKAGAQGRLKLCGKIIACLGSAAQIVGREQLLALKAVEPLANLLGSVHRSIASSEDPRIEPLLESWGKLSSVLEEHFLPFMPLVLPVVLSRARVTEQSVGSSGGGFFSSGELLAPSNVSKELSHETLQACKLLCRFAESLHTCLPGQTVRDIGTVLLPIVGHATTGLQPDARVEALRASFALLACQACPKPEFASAMVASTTAAIPLLGRIPDDAEEDADAKDKLTREVTALTSLLKVLAQTLFKYPGVVLPQSVKDLPEALLACLELSAKRQLRAQEEGSSDSDDDSSSEAGSEDEESADEAESEE
eukprot:gene16499-25298_t